MAADLRCHYDSPARPIEVQAVSGEPAEEPSLLRPGCGRQMKSWISALAAMSMKLAAPRVGCSPSMKSDVESP